MALVIEDTDDDWRTALAKMSKRNTADGSAVTHVPVMLMDSLTRAVFFDQQPREGALNGRTIEMNDQMRQEEERRILENKKRISDRWKTPPSTEQPAPTNPTGISDGEKARLSHEHRLANAWRTGGA